MLQFLLKFLIRVIDLDHELKLSGIGNIISGLFGGLVGFLLLGPSAFNHLLDK